MKKTLSQKNKNEGGFSLIETLIAVFILATSISALLVITGGGLKSQNIAKERLTAQYLAQEGVELVRNVRDTFELTTEVVSSIDEVTHPLNVCLDSGCTIDPITFEVEACASDGEIVCPNLTDTSDGSFGYGGLNETNFQRVIQIESKQAGRAFTVTSIVKWGPVGSGSSVTYKSDLFSWM